MTNQETHIAVLEERLRQLNLQIDAKIVLLQSEIAETQREADERIAYLETRNAQLEARLRTGKGVLLGIMFTLGTLGVVAFDKIRHFLNLVK